MIYQVMINVQYDAELGSFKLRGFFGPWVDIGIADDVAIADFVRATARREQLVSKADGAISPAPVNAKAARVKPAPAVHIRRIHGDGTRAGHIRCLSYAMTVGDLRLIGMASDQERADAAELLGEMFVAEMMKQQLPAELTRYALAGV